MTTAIPPTTQAEANPASTTLGTAELKRHIAVMFGDSIPVETADSID